MLRKLSILFVLSLFTIGCGDSGDGTVNENHSGTIDSSDPAHEQDGSNYDEYTFSTNSGNRIVVTMESTEVDAFLHLFGPDGNQVAQNDDYNSDNTNSQITFNATESGTYKVWANTLSAGETGAYTLRIEAGPAN